MSRSTLPRIAVPFAVAAFGVALCLWLVPAEIQAVDEHLIGFPDADATAHHVRPFVVAGLAFLPTIAAFFYSLGGRLDRYLARHFLGIFGICLLSLFMVWLLIDLEDNLSDFRESSFALRTAAIFYGTRAPAIALVLLPYVLLLSLLYSLGKLSTNREIVAMIQTGRGLLRVTAPLIGAGVFISLLCLGLNYHWAPVAEGRKDEILDAARGKLVTEATDVLYRDPARQRLWMVAAFPKNFEKGEPLHEVEVTTTHPDGSLRSRMSAGRAAWDRDSRTWTFDGAEIARFESGRPPIYEVPEGPITRKWQETPSQIIKPGLAAGALGVPELNSWLRQNEETLNADPAPYLTQWHYRWALPFTCLVTVMLAAPLAIHFSRRGPGGGVVLAVALSALMMLVSSITLSFGEAGLIAPALAAWLPNIAFTLLGLYLFHRRITGRPIYQSVRRLFPVED